MDSSATILGGWSVVLPLPIGAYTFSPPFSYSGAVPIGHRVVVPWQDGLHIGIVVGSVQDHLHRLREVISVLDLQPWVLPSHIEVFQMLASRYLWPLGLLFKDVINCGWHSELEHQVSWHAGVNLGLETSLPSDHHALDQLRSQGLLHEHIQIKPRSHWVYRACTASETLTPKQQHAHTVLAAQPHGFVQLSQWAQAAQVGTGVLAAVINRGGAQRVAVASPPPSLPAPHPLRLTPATDAMALYAPFGNRAPLHLRLHGGTPRTRLSHCLALIQQTLAQGQQVLYVVPEHHQLDRAWVALSGVAAAEDVLQYSGHLSNEQREYAWHNSQHQQPRLVIGTLASLSLPLANLGLIIVEDEASDAYKTLSGTRFWALDVIQALREHLAIPMLYVGTVPACESLMLAGTVLPPPEQHLHIVDYGQTPQQPSIGPLSEVRFSAKANSFPLSHELKQALKQVAERQRHAVVFAPRRGYSALLRCSDCGHWPSCPHCDVALRYHSEPTLLMCHQCGFRQSLPQQCPECEGVLLSPKGPGTEWMSQEIQQLLPHFSVYRYDKSHKDNLSALYQGEAGIVVATQALLSQPVLPQLSLVAIALADTALQVPDFRSAERLHAFIRQLIEWHPRRHPFILIQTFQGQHPIFRHLTQRDDAAAYPASELSSREALGYPPFQQLMLLQFTSRTESRTEQAMQALLNHLQQAGVPENHCLGPVPVQKRKGLYSQQLLIRCGNANTLEQYLGLLQQTRWPARLTVDIHPKQLSFFE